MSEKSFYVPKQSDTYSDALILYGLAALAGQIYRSAKGPDTRWRMTLEDHGSHYALRVDAELTLDELSSLPSLAPYLTSDDEAAPEGLPTQNVTAAREQLRAWNEQRRALAGSASRDSELEQQVRDLAPADEVAVALFVGDSKMQAIGIYNRLVAQWPKVQPNLSAHLKAIFAPFDSPGSDPQSALKAWAKLAGQDEIEQKGTASQLLNPHQGKGANELKANALRIENIKDRPWPVEFLKVVGLWCGVAPRRTIDTNDWKVYVVAPLRITWQDFRAAFAEFNRYLWREGGQTTLKTDITSVLLLYRAWLNYVEAAASDQSSSGLPLSPEAVIAGFYVAQFKLLSSQAYTMLNMSFLSMPAWGMHLRNRADVLALQEVIDEHLDVVRGVDETRSSGFDLLRRYRDFLSTGDWQAFFDFAAGYGQEILRRLNEGRRSVPLFSVMRLRRLIMSNNRKDLTQIVENVGFQNVAYAIRHATVIPQSRKARGQDALYEVRYGLGAELKRKSAVRDEFVVALTDFIQSYNQENAQKLESTNRQLRRDIRTNDIAEVVRLIDEYGAELVANLLIAFGYARESREEQEEQPAA
jgi:hypothetical protein